MRIFKKIVKIFFLVFFLILIVLAFLGWFFEDRIEQLVIRKVGETINTPLGIKSVSFSLIRDFPLATIQLNKVWMGAQLTDPSMEIDTLVSLEKLYVIVESKPLLDNIFNIHEVELEHGFAKYLVDTAGVSCYDFLISAETAEVDTASSKPFEIALDELALKDLLLVYKDDQQKMQANASISELEGIASIDSLGLVFSANGGLALSHLAIDSTNLHKLNQADLVFDLSYDNDSLLLDRLNILADGAQLDLSGKMHLGEKIGAEILLAANSMDLNEFGKYVPDELFSQYEISRLGGKVDLTAHLSGADLANVMPHYEVDLTLKKGQAKWSKYPIVRDVDFQGSIHNGILNNNSTTSLAVNSLRLNTGGSSIRLNGSFQNFDQLHYKLRSHLQLNLGTSNVYLPDSLISEMEGQVIADINTNGVLPENFDKGFLEQFLQASSVNAKLNNVSMEIDSVVTFKQLSGLAKYKDFQIDLDSLSGSLPDYELEVNNNKLRAHLLGNKVVLDSVKVDWPRINLKAPGVVLTGHAIIDNPNHPDFQLEASIDADLEEAKRLVPDSLVKSMTGRVKAKVSTRGILHLDSLSEQIQQILYNHTDVQLELSEVGVSMPDSLLHIAQLNGKAVITPKLITLKDFSGSYDDILFKTDTTVVKNLYQTLLLGKGGRLEVEGVYRFDHIDYSELMALIDKFTSQDSQEEKTEKVSSSKDVPAKWDYEIKGKLFVKSALYKKAYIRDISGLFNVKDSLYVVDQLQFKAFNGSMKTSLRILLNKRGEMELYTRNKLERMNIRQLLFEMENFDSDYFTYKNISGVLTTEELNTRLVFIGDSILYQRTGMTGDFLLEQGGIYNFEPVEVLAPSIPNVDRLDTLEFKTISTNLFVFKDKLCIPKIFVVSNIFDVSTLGMQSFDMDYEYHLEVKLGEVLLGTSKKREREKESIEVSEKKNEKEFKWIKLYSEENNEPKVILFPGKTKGETERALMEQQIFTNKKSLSFLFDYVVSFDTKISEYLKDYN